MPRDYSSRRNNPPAANGKRKPPKRAKPAATSARAKSSAGRQKPGGNKAKRHASSARMGARGGIWLVCGLLIAIVAGSFYYIASRPAAHGPESVSINLPKPSQASDADANGGAESTPQGHSAAEQSQTRSKPRFAFYKMLPNYKVKVPAGQKAAKVHANTPHETEPATNTPEPSPENRSPSTANHRSEPAARPASSPHQGHASASGYVIQAGAFSSHDDADHRKARLALLGVTADIVSVHTSSGKTVYRVQSETVPTGAKAQSLAQRLKSHGIETMVRHAH